MTISSLGHFEYRERARRAVEAIGVAAAVLVQGVCRRNPEIKLEHVDQAQRLISHATLAASFVKLEPERTKTAARRHVQGARRRLQEAVDNAAGFDFDGAEQWQEAVKQATRAIEEADKVIAS